MGKIATYNTEVAATAASFLTLSGGEALMIMARQVANSVGSMRLTSTPPHPWSFVFLYLYYDAKYFLRVQSNCFKYYSLRFQHIKNISSIPYILRYKLDRTNLVVRQMCLMYSNVICVRTFAWRLITIY